MATTNPVLAPGRPVLAENTHPFEDPSLSAHRPFGLFLLSRWSLSR